MGLWNSKAAPASDEWILVTPPGQGDKHLVRDRARAIAHVVPAVAQRQLIEQCVPVVAVHVAKATGALVAGPAVEFDEDAELVISHIAVVGKSGMGGLTIAARETVGTLNSAQVEQLERRLRSICDVGQQVGQQGSMSMAGAVLQAAQQAARRGES